MYNTQNTCDFASGQVGIPKTIGANRPAHQLSTLCTSAYWLIAISDSRMTAAIDKGNAHVGT